jgi:hypothetical protein
MPRLFRRREVLLPTLWGWLLIGGAIVAASVLGGRQLGPWLAVTEPRRAARVVVIEGWLREGELDDAAAYVRARGYSRVITSGGPIRSFSSFASYAERAAHHLRQRLPDVAVDAAPTPYTAQDRTFASAVWVRDWATQRGVALDAVDIYSLGPHARRTRWLYRLAFGPDSRVGIIAGVPREGDAVRWWTTSESGKAVLMEAGSLLWTACCFWPPPRGSHEERWAVPPATRP